MADMTGSTELTAITPIIRNNLYKSNYFHTGVRTSNSKAKSHEEALDS